MKILISLSAWLATPPPADRREIASLPDGFTVVRSRERRYGSARQEFLLMKSRRQAGSAVVWHMVSVEPKVDAYWLDVIHLEERYRGKGLMRALLRVVLEHVEQRPILVNAHVSNIATFAAVGFVPVKNTSKYEAALNKHHRWMNYTRPYEDYTLLILRKSK